MAFEVLHVASFMGNIGDNANHKGTRAILKRNLGCDLNFHELEIRKCYANYSAPDKFAFNDEFANMANTYDLVLIGGGNFFELRHNYSSTGTTIDMSPNVLKMIKTPLIFNSLGCDIAAGVTRENKKNFRRFISAVFEQQNCLISLRNDGSYKTFENLFGVNYAKEVYHVPDGGFFTYVPNAIHPEYPLEDKYIVVNLAIDMESIRFPGSDGYLSYRNFCHEFAEVLCKLLEEYPSFQILFAPHIFSDLKAISNLMDMIPDHYLRERISCLPLLNGMVGHDYIFDIYDQAIMTMGFRFHSNVCSIALGTPSIGLVSYPQVSYLYEELGVSERSIKVNQPSFAKGLSKMVSETLENLENIQAQYREIVEGLRVKIDLFHKKIGELLHNN